ncbi:MAG: DUF1983 domain-containing protein [Pseudomonadota bacterium]
MAISVIGSAIASALFAGSVIAAKIITAGLSFAATLAFQYFNRPKKRKYTAVQGERQAGADVPVTTVFGTSAVKGHFVYYHKWGKGNKRNAYVFRLATGWCDGLDPRIYFYGEERTLEAQTVRDGEAARYFVSGFGDKFEIRFYDGRPGQQADSRLVSITSGSATPWRSTSRGTNLCYVVMELTYDGDLFEQGIPEPLFVLRGLRQYDPRKDDTVSGGTGTHRRNDPATWEHTQKPAIHRQTYMYGVRGVRSGRAMIGRGYEETQIHLSSHMTAASTTFTLGGISREYAASLFVQSSDDHLEIEREFEDAMAGFAMPVAGLSGVVAGAPEVSVFTIEKKHIRTNAAKQSSSGNVLDAVNVLSGQYTEPSNQWAAESLNTITVNADITEDGGKAQSSNDFLQVTDPDIAQYLLQIRYRQNRLTRREILPLTRAAAFVCTLGRVVTYNGSLWRVTRWDMDARVQVTVELSEHSNAIYDENTILPGPVISPNPSPANPSVVRQLSNFTVATGLIQNQAGGQTPNLQFQWSAPDDPTITQIIIEYRVQGETDAFTTISNAPEGGVHFETANVFSGNTYEARALIITVPDRLRQWTAWQTTATEAGNLLISLGEAQADVYGAFKTLTEQNDYLLSVVEAMAGNQTINDADAYRLRKVITREQGNLRAQIVTEQEARVTGDAALAQTLTAVQADLDDAETAVSANATAVQQLQSTVNAAPVFLAQAAQPATTYPLGSLWKRTSDPVADFVLEDISGTPTWVDRSTAGMTVFAQDSEPTTDVVGALWYDTDDGNKTYRWNGSSWVSVQDQAIANLTQQVQAVEGDATAGGLFKIEAQAAPSGVSAQIAMLLRATTSDQYKEGGLFLQLYDDNGTLKARVAIAADQFVVFDPDTGDTSSPLTFENGQLTAEIARFREATAEGFNLENNKGKFGTLAPGVFGIELRY